MSDDSIFCRKMRLSAGRFLVSGLFVFLLCTDSRAQLSKPVPHDDSLKDSTQGNKFLSREATDDAVPMPKINEDELANSHCPQHVELRWQTEVSSSIYASPLISDIDGNGKLEIVVPTFVHYLEVLDGADGEKLPGWPAYHQSTVHASALVYDIDKDGSKEIALATYNGDVLFFRSAGYQLPEKLSVPRRKVKKDWYVGLDRDHVDRSHPDVHEVEAGFNLSNRVYAGEGIKVEKSEDGTRLNESDEKHSNNQEGFRRTLEHGGSKDDATTGQSKDDSSGGASGDESHLPSSNLTLDVDVAASGGLDLLGSKGQQFKSTGRRSLLQDATTGENKEESESEYVRMHAVTAEDQQEPLEEEANASWDVFRDPEQNGEDWLTEEYDYDYDDYVNEDMWGDNEWDEAVHAKLEDYVEVDSHILCTPVIADIDNDGVDEMIVAASYFYDREYYEMPEHANELGKLDIGKYIAGAVVVFNLETKQVKWDALLDYSTDSTSFRAYIYSAPTVVDLDGDGNLEIIVGTSMGFLYVLHSDGKPKKGFPVLKMGEIQGQVVAADINDDGKIELIATDSVGNVAVWDENGKGVWDTHLKSLISQGPTVGDVDGDGHTDVVVATTSGNIYVLNGKNGSHVKPYPFRTHGRVMAPPLLVDLNKRDAERIGLTIAVGSFDGYLYLIDGPTGCAEAIDIGETTYTMVVADNVDGGDDLDLIVSTMNGNVYCFQTNSPHHPLKAWPGQLQGRNVLASRYEREGIYVVPTSRGFRDEGGDHFHVVYEIVDKYRQGGTQGPYQVKVTLMTPGNYRGEKRFTYNVTHNAPGQYTATLPCVQTRTGGSVLVEMQDRNSLYFYDEFSLTFHMHYYRLLKWLLTIPLLGMTGLFFVFRPEEGAPLPSFTTDRHQL